MKRTFQNPLNLPGAIILFRLRTQDSFAEIQVTNAQRTDETGMILFGQIVEAIDIESTLTDEQINNLLNTPQTTQETDMIQAVVNALAGFGNLPDWATDTAQGAADRIVNAIFSGQTIDQVNANIDALPNTVAGMKTGLKSAASNIITIRSILINIAKAIVFIRDYLIRPRR